VKVTQWTPWVSRRTLPKGRQHSTEQQIYFTFKVAVVSLIIFAALGAFLITYFK
jgi:hypothetical protein